MLAAVAKIPELQCEHVETKALAEAVAEVAKHYPQQVIDPVTLAWFNLTLVAGTFYGSRVIVMRERMKAERAQKRGAGRTNGGPVAVPDPAFSPSPNPAAAQPAPTSHFEIPPGAFTGDLSQVEIKPTKLDG